MKRNRDIAKKDDLNYDFKMMDPETAIKRKLSNQVRASGNYWKTLRLVQ